MPCCMPASIAAHPTVPSNCNWRQAHQPHLTIAPLLSTLLSCAPHLFPPIGNVPFAPAGVAADRPFFLSGTSSSSSLCWARLMSATLTPGS